MVKNKYENIKKKYPKLPSFEDINNEFEIALIEKTDFLVRSIKRKIGEKLELTIEIIDKIMQPEHVSLVELYEFKCFSNEEKKELLEIFKKIMVYYRHLMYTDLLRDEKENIEIITKITNEWPEIRKEIASYIKKLEQCWTKPHEVNEILEYLG